MAKYKSGRKFLIAKKNTYREEACYVYSVGKSFSQAINK